MSGERRMEAENYLADGYGIRLAFQSRPSGWVQLRRIARVWQPNRLKGIQVSPEFGVPFLAATQVFDLRPVPRKWLSLDRTENAQERFAKRGDILVTCSGSVGRATLITTPLENTLISHDLLRVHPLQEHLAGWIYAFLRSRAARAMMLAARYGHIIKHLEVGHLDPLPVPVVRDAIAKEFANKMRSLLAKRDKAHELKREVEDLLVHHIGEPSNRDNGEAGFELGLSHVVRGRRRLDAAFHTPAVRAIRAHFAKKRLETVSIKKVGFDVWLPTRFKRVPAAEGVEFLDSSDLFEVSPDITKRIADGDFGDRARGRVKAGWLLLARSGQIYGLNGSIILANHSHEGKVVSDHIIRIAPNERRAVRTGYVCAVLSHPRYGRPLLKSLAYGSSIPEIDLLDVEQVEIPRLEAKAELKLADLAEESASLFAEADIDEADAAKDADKLIARFLSGNTKDFVLRASDGNGAGAGK